MTTTSNIGLTLLEASQSQKEVTINEALQQLDALAPGRAVTMGLSAPPATPIAGQLYIVGAGASGDWAGHAQQLAYFSQSWHFIVPAAGLRLWLSDLQQWAEFDGTAWQPRNIFGELRLAEQSTILSQSLAEAYPYYIWPMIWLSTEDNHPNPGGSGHPVCSITLENRAADNRFGEIAFARREGGVPVDTWSWAVDAERVGDESFRLRHRGQLLLDAAADNSKISVFTNFVLDGTNATGLQSSNASGAIVNLMRVASGNYVQLGTVSTDIAGLQVYSGIAGLALQFDGATAQGWFPKRLAIGVGASGGSAKLTIYGEGSEGNDGQTLRLGANSGADYAIRREISTGTLEFQGSQVGARGFKFMDGAMAIGNNDAAACAKLEVQSTSQGVLFPRMTTSQKNAITSPVAGLVVYDTTLNKLCVRTASAWETITSG